jgi:hypothetical protein
MYGMSEKGESKMKKILIVIFVLFFLFGCGKDEVASMKEKVKEVSASEITLVKESTSPVNPSVTIGNAVKAAFEDVKWKVGVTPKGEKFVEVSGKITKNLHDEMSQKILQEYKDEIKAHAERWDFAYVNRMRELEYWEWLADNSENMFWFKLGEDNIFIDCKKGEDSCVRDPKAFKPEEREIELLENIWKVGTEVRIFFPLTVDDKFRGIGFIGSAEWKNCKRAAALDNYRNIIVNTIF